MNFKKQMAALAVLGVMTCTAVGSVFAAGVGYVNAETLVSAHKNTPKAVATMRAEVEKAQKEFQTKSANMSAEDKQKLAQEMEQNLNKKQADLFQPIRDDIRKKVDQVRKEKGLDVIVEQGGIVAGGENAVDVTNDVSKKIS